MVFYVLEKEDALKKKILAVKMVPRFSVSEAICELIVLSGKRKASDGFVEFGFDCPLLLSAMHLAYLLSYSP